MLLIVGSIREGGAHIMCSRGMVNVSRVTVGTYEGGVDSTVGVRIAEQSIAEQNSDECA